MKKIFTRETKIGLLAIIALLVLFFGINYLKGMNIFKPANYYYVSYTDVNGLALSAPVTVNGYKVGIVRSIDYEYDNPGHIRVELSLNRQLRVPTGSKAIIETDMLGTASIVLHMAPGDGRHDVGDHLVGETHKGIMQDLSTGIMPNVTSIMTKVDSLVSALNVIASNPALNASVSRLDDITASLERTLASVNSAVNRLPATMNSVQATAGNLNAISANLDTLSTQLRALPIESTMRNVEGTSQNLLTLTGKLNDPNSSLGLMMNDRKLYDNINSSVSDLDSLFVDIKRNPKRYISIKLL